MTSDHGIASRRVFDITLGLGKLIGTYYVEENIFCSFYLPFSRCPHFLKTRPRPRRWSDIAEIWFLGRKIPKCNFKIGFMTLACHIRPLIAVVLRNFQLQVSNTFLHIFKKFPEPHPALDCPETWFPSRKWSKKAFGSIFGVRFHHLDIFIAHFMSKNAKNRIKRHFSVDGEL